MANYKIEFFGWCNEPEHNADKIWGYVSIGDDSRLYNFWGRRGKTYTFKRYDKPGHRWDRNVLEDLTREKTKPGRKNGAYRRIAPADVMKIVPNFEQEFEHQLAMAKLFDKFHGETVNDD